MTTAGNLYASFQAAAANAGNRLFLDTGNARSVSFGELDQRVAAMAAIIAAAGVRPGDRLAAQIEKSPEAVLLYLATLRAGAVFVPLNSAYTAAEIKGFVEDAEPALLICDPRSEESYKSFAPALLTLAADGSGTLTDALPPAADSTPPSPVPRDPEDLAAILYTSGTTGRSKGAMLSHRALLANAQALVGLWRWSAADVLIHALPINHVHGLFIGLHLPLLTGSTVRFLPKFDADRIITALRGATSMMGVPTFYTRLLDNPAFTRELAGPMRLFISGSAPLLPQTFAAFQERTGHAILERYGMTEAGMITSNPYDGLRLAGTVGYPLPHTQVRIADGGDGPGVLEIKGPGLFSGYWRMPEKTAEEHSGDGWFITGDIATIADDGRVAIVGRAKDLIIAGGYNIYPKEIELLIDALPGVGESAVIGVPHPDLGETVVAVVTPEPGAALSETAIVEAITPSLARFKLPRRIVITAELPRNAMGKVEKARLRTEHAGLFRA